MHISLFALTYFSIIFILSKFVGGEKGARNSSSQGKEKAEKSKTTAFHSSMKS